MPSYLNINELAESPTFRGRVQAAIAIKAGYVLGEDDDKPQRAAKRIALAERALADPAQLVNSFVWIIVGNGTVAAKGMDTPDSDLEYVIGSAWDRVAGVTESDATKGPPA